MKIFFVFLVCLLVTPSLAQEAEPQPPPIRRVPPATITTSVTIIRDLNPRPLLIDTCMVCMKYYDRQTLEGLGRR